MNERPAEDTRTRILRTALELFGGRGYERTSVREIAERVGLTKTAVLYHFSTKADILVALATPIIADLEAALDVGTAPGDPRTRWSVIEGLLETYLTHRDVLHMVMQDMRVLTQEPVFHRFVDMMTLANHLVAGPSAGLADQVRAAQAIAMLSDPVILLARTPTGPLRLAVLDGVRRLYAVAPETAPETVPGAPPESVPEAPSEAAVPEAPPEPAPETPPDTTPKAADQAAPGRRAGRPGAMTPEMIGAARRMHASGAHTMAEIAAAVGVSRATLYRHLPV
ncbi:TetR family transcriptional regulator [Sphaerisporangium corydalis]|uniref:TetR family transcriptional regulator n=1 Tax=Sphaerisporangium corydalis TaxID=1441875 RepID=A0ABV9ESN6_9ACTN|nr:TetR family transcriptional regulator [Sphaerisporangium corydalis]